MLPPIAHLQMCSPSPVGEESPSEDVLQHGSMQTEELLAQKRMLQRRYRKFKDSISKPFNGYRTTGLSFFEAEKNYLGLNPQKLVRLTLDGYESKRVRSANVPRILSKIQGIYPEIVLQKQDQQLLALVEQKLKLRTIRCHIRHGHQHTFPILEKALQAGELTIGKLVDFIFEEGSRFEVPQLLEQAQQLDSTWKLSAYDTIRLEIIKDLDCVLNNAWLEENVLKHSLEAHEAQACYHLAHRMGHPFLYRVAEEAILETAYTLNFLWVNLNPQDRIADCAEHIFGEGLAAEYWQSVPQEGNVQSHELEKSFTYRLSRWAAAQPNACMHLWYDSALVTKKAQLNTLKMLAAISLSSGVSLQLRDIRMLPNIKLEIWRSLHPATPVYYRVDELKVLIANYMLQSELEKAKFCAVIDIDVQPMSKAHLFDQTTLDFLATAGYVFNGRGLGGFENSFFIFNKEFPGLQEIHHKTMIKKTARQISLLRDIPSPSLKIGPQFVYNLYNDFRAKMGERKKNPPRKFVMCPASQFNYGGFFAKADHQSETFRFIGTDSMPYTRNGRSQSEEESQIAELKNWICQPLELA